MITKHWSMLVSEAFKKVSAMSKVRSSLKSHAIPSDSDGTVHFAASITKCMRLLHYRVSCGLVVLALTTTLFLGFAASTLLGPNEGRMRSSSLTMHIRSAQDQDIESNASIANNTTMPITGKFQPPEAPQDANTQRSKGIIICLYSDIVPLGVSLIRELRCLDNWEPIEVYHCSELSTDSQNFIQSIDANVRVIDICFQLVSQGRFSEQMASEFRSYWIKPLAVHESNLSEIILMDADVVLLKNPSLLREVPGYESNGTLFFYDRVLPYQLFLNRYGRQMGSTFVFNEKIAEQDIIRRSWTGIKRTGEVQYLHHWLETFDYSRFNTSYGPSQHLLDSLAYASETAHEQDSSMLLVNKTRGQSAMEVLWFLITDHRFKFRFSWGDKEAFWLAYEFSHTPYFFSPWGASVMSSTTNHDMEAHPTTLCGSLAHFTPIEDAEPELFYVNGRTLVDPVPLDPDGPVLMRPNHFFNMLPTHMTPRHKRTAVPKADLGKHFTECLVGLGATEAPPELQGRLWRRRIHFLAAAMNRTEALAVCESPLGF